MFFTNLIIVACILSLRATAAETNITGELKQWHKVTLTVDGPFAQESDGASNPFLDYRMTVTFIHESGSPHYRMPGYFAADGNAAQTSATACNKWRAHLSPDKPGRWNYEVSLLAGKHVAVDGSVAPQALSVLHTTGSFDIAPTYKSGRDFRGKGRLQYAGKRYLQFAGSKEFFLNAGGDGDDVWPFVSREDKLHYDCSKLDQWQIVLDHAQQLGLYLHFKLQETENDDNRSGDSTNVPAALDAGELGFARKLYLRELIARFGCLLALNWNLGEENSQTTEQQRAVAQYLHDIDPYAHHLVVHTFPDWQDRVYPPLLGGQSALTGASLQNSWSVAHQRVLHWLRESEKAGRPWVVANDEQNPHYTGVPPDSGYAGFDGVAPPEHGNDHYTLHDIRKYTLWGTFLAGGAGVEYYFGYTLPQNDLGCEDWRSRDRSWDYCRMALDFFREHGIPFWEMQNADTLVGNQQYDNSKYCFAHPGKVYVVYLPNGGSAKLELSDDTATFRVQWFNPREGGPLQSGSMTEVKGPGVVWLGQPPADADQDWVVLIRK